MQEPTAFGPARAPGGLPGVSVDLGIRHGGSRSFLVEPEPLFGSVPSLASAVTALAAKPICPPLLGWAQPLNLRGRPGRLAGAPWLAGFVLPTAP